MPFGQILSGSKKENEKTEPRIQSVDNVKRLTSQMALVSNGVKL